MSTNVNLSMSHFCFKPSVLPLGLEIKSTLLLAHTGLS